MWIDAFLGSLRTHHNWKEELQREKALTDTCQIPFTEVAMKSHHVTCPRSTSCSIIPKSKQREGLNSHIQLPTTKNKADLLLLPTCSIICLKLSTRCLGIY